MFRPVSLIVCSFLTLILSSCGREVDCKLLFPDDDSIISIANSGDDDLNSIVAEMYTWRSKKEAFGKQIIAHENSLNMAIMDVESFSDYQYQLERLRMDQQMAAMYEKLCEQRIKQISFESYDIAPYSGTCTMKTADEAKDSLKAEFEDGVIVGEWKKIE